MLQLCFYSTIDSGWFLSNWCCSLFLQSFFLFHFFPKTLMTITMSTTISFLPIKKYTGFPTLINKPFSTIITEILCTMLTFCTQKVTSLSKISRWFLLFVSCTHIQFVMFKWTVSQILYLWHAWLFILSCLWTMYCD